MALFFGKKPRLVKRHRFGAGLGAQTLVVIVVGYVLWQSFHPGSPVDAGHGPVFFGSAGSAAPVNTTDCGHQENVIEDFSHFAHSLFPSYTPRVRMEEKALGIGAALHCGQKARFRYRLETPAKQVVFDDLGAGSAPAESRIGDGAALKGIELGLIGMKAGGERLLLIPPVYALEGGALEDGSAHPPAAQGLHYDASMKDKALVGRVKLEAVLDASPDDRLPLRFIDQGYGGGLPSVCGDTVTLTIRLWKLDGTPLYATPDNAPLHYRIGSGALSAGLEQAALALPEGKERIVILPPGWNAPYDAQAPSVLPVTLPGETLLAVLKRLPPPVEAKTPAAAKSPAPVSPHP